MKLYEFLRDTLSLVGLNWARFNNRRTRRVLSRTLAESGLRSLEEYRTLLLSNPAEIVRLREVLSITISRFWRNDAVFSSLQRKVLPALLSELAAGEPLVVWSAGTASGQEAFSVVAAFSGIPVRRRSGHELCVIASDIRRVALLRGMKDRWTAGEFRELPLEAAERILQHAEDGPQVRQQFRRHVLFVQSDLFSHPPVQSAHVVLCRNAIMTYFDKGVRRQALGRIISILNPNGYLVLGRKEAIPAAWARAWGLRHLGRKIYRLEEHGQNEAGPYSLSNYRSMLD